MNAPSQQADLPGAHPRDLLVDTDTWTAAIAAAGTAPSIHNTQPWRFVLHGNALELHLDPHRMLSVADPTGREARLSCGAALLNLRVALQAGGVEPAVGLMPIRSHATLLAIVRPASQRTPSPAELALHDAVSRRHSHRQPFHPATVPQSALQAVVYAAGTEGAYLRLMQDPPMVNSVAAMIRQAEHLHSVDTAYQTELARWTFHHNTHGGREDGVPHSAAGPRPEPGGLLALRDFAPHEDRPTRPYEPDPLFGLLLSAGDSALDQLRCGQALQLALLTATSHGVGASIISAPTEMPATRSALRRLAGSTMWPQLLLRLGSAQPTTTTPRRAVTDLMGTTPDDTVAVG